MPRIRSVKIMNIKPNFMFIFFENREQMLDKFTNIQQNNIRFFNVFFISSTVKNLSKFTIVCINTNSFSILIHQIGMSFCRGFIFNVLIIDTFGF